MYKIDLKGNEYGDLKVTGYNEEISKIKKKTIWNCQCKCGEIIPVEASNLKSGNTTQCRKCAASSRIIDLRGKEFGKLKVIEFLYSRNKKTFWKCQCECGKITIVRSDCLQDGNTKSCGKCQLREYNDTHFDKRTQEKLYYVWAGMKSRCSNPNHVAYEYYGARGIRVCSEWNGSNSYPVFKKWALSNGYKEGLAIDRINVDGNYEPLNCRWVTQEIQNENKRLNIYYTYNRKTMLLKDWSKILGIKEETLYSRINTLGWSVEKAFTTKTNEI